MEDKFSFMYDDFSDRLMISCKKNSDNIIGSVRILNLVLDFTTNNKIVNIELKKASDYLKSLKINPSILNNLVRAEIVFKQCRDGYLIYFLLQDKNKIEKIPYNIYSQKPVLLN
jgi:hypothetical protein